MPAGRALLLLAVVTAFALTLVGCRRAHERTASADPVSSGDTHIATPSAQPPGTTQSAVAPAMQARRFHIGDTHYSVESMADVDWLERNLYPTDDEIDAASQYLRDGTPRDLDGSLSPALVARAEVAAWSNPGLRELAIGRLEEAATSGSIYALRALQRIYTAPALRDVVKSEMYGHIAWMRGDWSSMTADDLNGPDRMRAELGAQRWLVEADARRRLRGLPPLGRDPKPGVVEWDAHVEQAARLAPSDRH